MGKVVIIGASKGIGEALSYVYARDKRELILVGRNIYNLEKVKKECENFGSKVDIFFCDLEEQEALLSLVTFLRMQTISIFIYNAGYAKVGKFLNMEETDIISQLQVNSIIPTIITRQLGETFIKCKSSICIIGSIASYFYGPGVSIYFATKNYIKSFTNSLYEEFKEFGVSVTLISPGFVETEMVKNNIKKIKLPRVLVSSPSFVALETKKAISKRKRTLSVGKINVIFQIASKFLGGSLFGKSFYKILKNELGEKHV